MDRYSHGACLQQALYFLSRYCYLEQSFRRVKVGLAWVRTSWWFQGKSNTRDPGHGTKNVVSGGRIKGLFFGKQSLQHTTRLFKLTTNLLTDYQGGLFFTSDWYTLFRTLLVTNLISYWTSNRNRMKEKGSDVHVDATHKKVTIAYTNAFYADSSMRYFLYVEMDSNS